MLTVIDVVRALSALLTEHFPNYNITDKEQVEGFDRPGFIIDIESVNTTLETSNIFTETANLDVFFFAENIYTGFLDLLKIKEKLQFLLTKPLSVDLGCHVTFDNINMNLSNEDKCLSISLTTSMYQQIDEYDEHDEMQSLDLDFSNKN